MKEVPSVMLAFDALRMETKALELLASLFSLRSSDKSLQSVKTCNFCISKVHSAIYDDIPDEMRIVLLDNVEAIVNAMINAD